MKDKIEKLIDTWVRANYGNSEAEDPSWNIKSLSCFLADSLEEENKLYLSEYRANNFEKGWHTLREWAEFGYNRVEFNGHAYWDGLMDGEFKIEDLYNPMLELDYWDTDEDGYKVVILKEVEEK